MHLWRSHKVFWGILYSKWGRIFNNQHKSISAYLEYNKDEIIDWYTDVYMVKQNL